MMMKRNSAATVVLVSFLLFGEAQGFCPQQQQPLARASPCSSALHLIPGQGNQLAAAYTASISKEEKEDDVKSPPSAENTAATEEPPSSSSHWRALAASRSFVSRVFHMPSSAIKKHPHPTLEGLKENDNTKKETPGGFPFNFMPQRQPEEEDAVLYPLVGFTFFKKEGNGSDSKVIALPTTSHAACRLPTNRSEDVFGWYSPACKLDLYSEDVCHAPLCDETESSARE